MITFSRGASLVIVGQTDDYNVVWLYDYNYYERIAVFGKANTHTNILIELVDSIIL